MGFKIPSARLNGRTANSTDFRIAFGNKNKLPQDNTVPLKVMFGDIQLMLLPPFVKVGAVRWGKEVLLKSSKHRVLAKCPCCNEMVPAGRSMQHLCEREFTLHWAPDGYTHFATVRAKSHRAAKRKAPMPQRRYLGEIEARG